MAVQILVKDARYEGKYVAMDSFTTKKIVASGTTLKMVYSKATKLGYKKPIVFYVPEKNSVCIY